MPLNPKTDARNVVAGGSKHMPDLLKNKLNYTLLRELALGIHSVFTPFQVESFLESTMDKTWDNLELKDRIYKIADNLGKYLPTDYTEAISIIDKVVCNFFGRNFLLPFHNCSLHQKMLLYFLWFLN